MKNTSERQLNSTTDDIPEGQLNLYYLDSRVDSRIDIKMNQLLKKFYVFVVAQTVILLSLSYVFLRS